MSRHDAGRAGLVVVLLLALGCAGACSRKDTPTGVTNQPSASDADRDGDGVPDSRDNCPDLAGEAAYGGCPWYKVDACSGSPTYAQSGRKWANLAPGIYCDASFPAAWRTCIDYAASAWNGAGSRLRLGIYSAPVTVGSQQDSKNVVSYGSVAAGKLGVTYTWYNTSNGIISETDIVISNSIAFSVGGGPSTYDVWSVLTHEFGHVCGLADLTTDRTQTMFYAGVPDCTIYRTLCSGDVAGVRALYP